MSNLIPVGVATDPLFQQNDYWTVRVQGVADPQHPYDDLPLRDYVCYDHPLPAPASGYELSTLASTYFAFSELAIKAARVALIGCWSKQANVLITLYVDGVPYMWGAFIVGSNGNGEPFEVINDRLERF